MPASRKRIQKKLRGRGEEQNVRRRKRRTVGRHPKNCEKESVRISLSLGSKPPSGLRERAGLLSPTGHEFPLPRWPGFWVRSRKPIERRRGKRRGAWPSSGTLDRGLKFCARGASVAHNHRETNQKQGEKRERRAWCRSAQERKPDAGDQRSRARKRTDSASKWVAANPP